MKSEDINEITGKIKVTDAVIVVTGTKEKPYYSIRYTQSSDGESFQGFGSYELNFVFDWFDECIEIESVISNE